jgi:hypothetical protein
MISTRVVFQQDYPDVIICRRRRRKTFTQPHTYEIPPSRRNKDFPPKGLMVLREWGKLQTTP